MAGLRCRSHHWSRLNIRVRVGSGMSECESARFSDANYTMTPISRIVRLPPLNLPTTSIIVKILVCVRFPEADSLNRPLLPNCFEGASHPARHHPELGTRCSFLHNPRALTEALRCLPSTINKTIRPQDEYLCHHDVLLGIGDECGGEHDNTLPGEDFETSQISDRQTPTRAIAIMRWPACSTDSLDLREYSLNVVKRMPPNWRPMLLGRLL